MSIEPYYDDGQITVYVADCRLADVPVLQPYIVVTDPPYGTGGWRRNSSGEGSNPSGALVREDWDDGDYSWIVQRSDAEAVVTFAPPARTYQALDAALTVGFDKHRAVYMQKRDPKPMPAGRVRWSMEPIWCLSRDGFVLLGETDSFAASTPRLGRDADATGHPYEKPLEVMTWLIAMLPQNLTILDPFAGSLTTAVAAKHLGRRCIAIEREEKYVIAGLERLRQGVLL